jgi:hypothetical protein
MVLMLCFSCPEREKRRDDSDVATDDYYGVASSSSWSNSIFYPENGNHENKRVLKITASFQG